MTVSLGILSTAHGHAHSYTAVTENIDDTEVVAVADEDEERGRAFAERHDIDHGPTEDVLDRVDAAIVCAANTKHAEWIERAAESGVDVLCEKPLTTKAKRADEVVETCANAGVSLGVAMPVRFNEPVRQAKAAVDAGDIGKVQAFIGTNLLKRHADGWLVDPELSGGGAVMDHSVHIIDLVRWFAEQEVAEVYATPGIDLSDTPVEDVDVLSMSLEDGSPVTHDGSWRQPEEWDHWGDVTLRIIGTEGILEVDCFDQTLKRTRDGGGNPGIESIYWGSDMNEGLVRDFAGAVRDDREPAIPGWEGACEVRVVEAAYESIETGEPVPIEY